MDCFIGRKGSGKSYNVVATVILPALRDGRDIVTNIPLTDEVEKDPAIKGNVYQFDIENLAPDFFDLKKIHRGAIYVLDEVQKLWPAGIQVSQFPKDQKRFISENRHMVGDNGLSTDIVLVTQDTELLARYPRNLIDKTYRCKKLDAVGMAKLYKVDIFDGAVSLSLQAESRLINSMQGKYSKDVYKYYKSHTINDTTYDSGLETINKNASIFSSKLFKFGMPLSIAFIIYAVFYLIHFFSDMSGQEKQTESNQVVATANVKPTMPVQQPIDSSASYSFSTVYRISYFVDSPKLKAAFITDNTAIFPIPLSDCKRFAVVGLTCKYGGQLINFYSGTLPTYEKDNSNNSILPIASK